MTGQRYDAFVSAVSSEFGRARDAAAAELRKHGRHVAVQSDFVSGPAGVTLLQRLHDTIRDCAEVHCIVGTRSGACPSAAEAAEFARFRPAGMAEASYTQWEFCFARHYAPERTWLYLAADAWPPDEPAPDDERPALQARFLDYLRQSGADHAIFANPGELRAEVLQHVVPRHTEAPAAAEHAPHEPMHRGIAVNAIGGTIGTVLGATLLSLPTLLFAHHAGGDALTALLLLPALALGAFGAALFFLLYRRYEAILAWRDADARADYAGLRQTLAGGGSAARVFARWLGRALAAVDHFFGDAEMADRTLFPHAFWLRERWPLWTAASFDRCLLLALLYPVGIILCFWIVSGDVGPAEHALQLQSHLPGWHRAVASVAVMLSVLSCWRALATSGWTFSAWMATSLLGAVGAAFAGAGWPVALPVMVPTGVRSASAAVVVVASGTAVGMELLDGRAPLLQILASAVLAVVGTLGVLWLNRAARRDRWLEWFQLLCFLVMAISLFLLPAEFASHSSWAIIGPPLLFFGLLTLINAPFDWAALGLTRALLRRGLELGSWFPYVLALTDAITAAGIIALLTIVSVLGVQAFDDLAVHAGGAKAAILPLDQLFNGIAANPSAPEYWWAYAMLFSTMIPSLLNLMIGGASLLRGIPPVTNALLRAMPADRAPKSHNRAIIALVLTGQVFLGAVLGIVAQAIFFYAVIGLLLPVFGLDLLGLARAVAAPDVPGMLIHWVLGPPAH